MTNKQSSANLCIFVFGYEGYSDVWNIFFSLLRKNWADNPLHTYFSAPHTNGIDYNFTFIETPGQKSWTERLCESLSYVKEEYILFLLEDFFISQIVNTNDVIDVFNNIYTNNIKYYKFKVQSFSIQYKKKFKFTDSCYYIDSNRKYGISFQPAIWNKNYLLSLITDLKLDAWKLENLLNEKSLIDDNNLGWHIFDNRNLLNIEHAIIRGKYTRRAYKLIMKHEMLELISHRKIIGRLDSMISSIKQILRKIIPGVTSK